MYKTKVHSVSIKSGFITTNDGIRINYLEAGSGIPLVMIPGWSQTAEQFKNQINGLSDKYRVIAVDMRSHGKSEKTSRGMRISRLSKDLFDLILTLDLKNIILLGHSMGCSVIWSYIDLFGTDRIAKFVFVDQSAFLTSNPNWDEQDKQNYGSLFDDKGVVETTNTLSGPDGVKKTYNLINSMVTSAISDKDKAWIIAKNLEMPRKQAADLFYNHFHQDWRNIIQNITLPTLVIGGRVSLIPWKSQEWIANQIKGAKLEIFEEHDGGQHFMFIEGPQKFNQIVTDFIGTSSTIKRDSDYTASGKRKSNIKKSHKNGKRGSSVMCKKRKQIFE
jgi:pimeloyl-ACP methyl ester carboxylesterase